MRALYYTCYNPRQLHPNGNDIITMTDLTITRPDDWHIHLRDDEVLKRTVRDASRYFGRVLVMPNLVPPVTQVAHARAYLDRIRACSEVDTFDPQMTLYLTDTTSKDTVVAASQSGFIKAFKLYPAGATTNSDAGVSAIQSLYPLFETMQEQDMVLSIHGEVTDRDIDIFDREAVFIDTVLADIVRSFPELRVVLEHITTREAVQFVASAGDRIAATITAHHLLYNRNDMLAGGMKPIHYCLPVLKRNVHQQALVEAAVSGDPHFFLGTDSAPHPRQAKENACGCAAGCYTAHAAIELYAEVFDAENRLEMLQGFASEAGADFYRVPRNTDEIQLTRASWQVADQLSFGQQTLVPTRGGEAIHWLVNSGAHHAFDGGVL